MGHKKPRNHSIASEECDQFRSAVGEVRPIVSDRVVHPPARKDAKRRPRTEAVRSDEAEPAEADSVGAEEPLYYLRNSLPHRLIRQMKRGELRPDSRIDLHGLTWPQAERRMMASLDHARTKAQRCLLVIHGKGYGSESSRPVLKNMLNGWLRRQPGVLMFCSAQAKDGGNGALYLLLQQIK